MTNLIDLLLFSLIGLLKFYLLILILRVTIEWFPNLDWYSQPILGIRKIANPYLRMFVGLMPPIFGIDLSICLGFIALQFLIQLLSSFTVG